MNFFFGDLVTIFKYFDSLDFEGYGKFSNFNLAKINIIV